MAGRGSGEVELSGHELWERGKLNRVTVLRGPDRAVVQIGDRTAAELAVSGLTAVEFFSPGADPEIRAAARCQADG